MSNENTLYFMADIVALKESVKDGKIKMSGILIHPGKTIHPNEVFKIRHYFAEDLEKAAETLKGKPIAEDHAQLLGCTFDWGKWNPIEVGVSFEATITTEVANNIKAGKYHGLSAAMNWERPGGGLKFVDGVAPYNFEFVEGSLLTSKQRAGDPKAYFKLMEAVKLYRENNGLPITEGAPEQDITKLPGFKEPGASETGVEHEDSAEEKQKAAQQHQNKIPSKSLESKIKEVINMEGCPLNKENCVGCEHTLNEKCTHPSIKEGDVKYYKEQIIRTPLTNEEINKQVDKRLMEALSMAAREAQMTELEKDLKEADKFIAHLVTKGKTIQEARKEQIGRMEIKEALKNYPEYVQQTFIGKLNEGVMSAVDMKKLLEAEWTTEYRNSLPDSAFAIINKSGRHLPFKDKSGNVDVNHLGVALGRLDQTTASAEELSSGKKSLCGAAKSEGITSEVCGLTESDYLVDARKELVEAKAEINNLKKQVEDGKQDVAKFAESIKVEIPDIFVTHSWSRGAQDSIQKIGRKVKAAGA